MRRSDISARGRYHKENIKMVGEEKELMKPNEEASRISSTHV